MKKNDYNTAQGLRVAHSSQEIIVLNLNCENINKGR